MTAARQWLAEPNRRWFCAAAPQTQRRPAVNVAAFGERKTLRPVGGEHARGITCKKPGQNQIRVRGRCARERGRQKTQGLRKNICKDQIVSAAHRRMTQAGGYNRTHIGASAIGARVGARRFDGDRIDVAGGDGTIEQTGGRDGENARAGADVNDTARPAPSNGAIESAQAPERRAVMSGAKGQRGLDLDPDIIGAQLFAVMSAMDDDASRAYRFQAGERVLNPILFIDERKNGLRRRLGVGRGGDQFAHALCLGLFREINLDGPGLAVGPLESGRGCFRRVESFHDEVRDGAGASFVAGQTHDMAGAIGGEAFKHPARLARPCGPRHARPARRPRPRGRRLSRVAPRWRLAPVVNYADDPAMALDVVDLRAFYETALGDVARRLVVKQLRARWDDHAGLRLLGIGFATPFLAEFREKAQRVLAFMPATQGVVHWPVSGRSATALVEASMTPLPDASIDRILVVHALEVDEHPQDLLEEIWRILAPGGRVMIVAPSRTGLWARVDTTPFGFGHPYSRGQLQTLLQEAQFLPLFWGEALYVPPFQRASLLRSAPAFERIAGRFSLPGGGVHLVEATKQLYRPILRRAARRVAVPQLEEALETAGAEAGLEGI